MDSLQTFTKTLTQGLKRVCFGGSGEITRFLCGYLACERRLSEVFLAGLPRLLKVSVANEPSAQWLSLQSGSRLTSTDGHLSQWRLKLGAEILQSTEESVAEVAAGVGYGSEAAFRRAFKRAFD